MRDLRNDGLLLHCLQRLADSFMCQDEVRDASNPLSIKRKSEAILTQIRRQSDVQLAGIVIGQACFRRMDMNGADSAPAPLTECVSSLQHVHTTESGRSTHAMPANGNIACVALTLPGAYVSLLAFLWQFSANFTIKEGE